GTLRWMRTSRALWRRSGIGRVRDWRVGSVERSARFAGGPLRQQRESAAATSPAFGGGGPRCKTDGEVLPRAKRGEGGSLTKSARRKGPSAEGGRIAEAGILSSVRVSAPGTRCACHRR